MTLADDAVSPAPSAPPAGRKLLRLEVRNSQTPIERKPPWIRTTARMGPEYRGLMKLVQEIGHDSSFSFLFSARPGTPAAELKDDTPMQVKRERLMRLQELLEEAPVRRAYRRGG